MHAPDGRLPCPFTPKAVLFCDGGNFGLIGEERETPNELGGGAILHHHPTVSTQIFLGAVPRTAGRRLRSTRESFRSQSRLPGNYDERQDSVVAGGPSAIFKCCSRHGCRYSYLS